jgi:hypothetical protein
MIRGSTPTHTFTIPFDVSKIKTLKIVYAQDDEIVCEKSNTDCDMEGVSIKTTLTQNDTLKFDCKKAVQIQMKILTVDGQVLVSTIERVGVSKCLDNEVLV